MYRVPVLPSKCTNCRVFERMEQQIMGQFSKKFRLFPVAYLCLMLGSALWNSQAAAQGSSQAHGSKSVGDDARNEEMKFEVISIRPVKPGWSPYEGGVAQLSNTIPTPTGFVSALTVWQMLMIAYAPSDLAWDGVPMINPPNWLHDPDWYVINARVSEADISAWRNQSAHHELLRTAMQDLLKKRCKLVAHKQPAELPDYKLVIGKKGLKMKATAPGAPLPKGIPLATGGVRSGHRLGDRSIWDYYGANIGELVAFLGNASPTRPIHDGTGLTGRYDFVMQQIDDPARDPEMQVYNWPVAPLGLELKPGSYHAFKLVIDHMEKPTPND